MKKLTDEMKQAILELPEESYELLDFIGCNCLEAPGLTSYCNPWGSHNWNCLKCWHEAIREGRDK